MRPMLTLIRREFTAYFLSPIAYVVMFVLLAVMGGLFAGVPTVFPGVVEQLTDHGPYGTEYPMQALIWNWIFWLVFLFIPPLLTMRLLAEERGSGTLELLLTAPLRDWQVVVAKYVACVAFYVVVWLPTLAYVPFLTNFDWVALRPRIDPWPVVTTYLGLFFAGAMFLALGLYVSSLVKSQMVAALLSIVLSLIFVAAAFLRPELDYGRLGDRLIYFVSVPMHFHRDFTRGLIDTRHLVLYCSLVLFCLFMTVRSLESRRWR